jgi:hypothetical protein
MTYYQNRFYQKHASPARPANADHAVVQAWKDAHPTEWAWIEEKSRRGFDFACSLNAGLHRYGSLTERQVAAIHNCIRKDAERTHAIRKIEASAPSCSVTALETAFAKAKDAGIKYPKLRFADFAFSPAGVRSRNPGAVYVKSRHDGTYYGKVHEGRFVRSYRECDEETEQAILKVCADPHTAAIAYGKQFGVCCCCGRELTDPKSVAKGIGPVCEKSYGWGA